MLKDILDWLCGKEIPEPEINKTELSINRRRYKSSWNGEEEVSDIALSYAVSQKPEERYLLVELSDMKRALYFLENLGDISEEEKKALIKEILKDLKPGTEVILDAKEDLDLFLDLDFALTGFESLPILKVSKKNEN